MATETCNCQNWVSANDWCQYPSIQTNKMLEAILKH